MSPMVIDAVLALVHFLGIGALVAVLAVQTALLRDAPTPAVIERLNKIDMGLGLAAVAILLAGAGRVVWGLKGADYYMGNPVFWVKIALFFAAGLASVPPTLAFISWRKGLKASSGFRPKPEALARVRTFIKLEWLLLVLIPLAAILMARDLP
jgi:putative membrane protein